MSSTLKVRIKIPDWVYSAITLIAFAFVFTPILPLIFAILVGLLLGSLSLALMFTAFEHEGDSRWNYIPLICMVCTALAVVIDVIYLIM